MLAIALIHYPVLDKAGRIIGSSVTNLDIHDIARAARTFGADRYFVVTPYVEERRLVTEIVGHWRDGYGARYNPARGEALSLVRVADSLPSVLQEMAAEYGKSPLVVATSARLCEKGIDYQHLQRAMAEGRAALLLFGTAHGLAQEVIDQADCTLPPIQGAGYYNHLSVRSAVSIVLDRLLGAARE
ncbi:MAG: RNA methyltransferase [Desulfobulbaceae bacterium]|jgi:hypothetical protein|nr:RNA methyltransferase [Desulfobulbaceae bacterium]